MTQNRSLLTIIVTILVISSMSTVTVGVSGAMAPDNQPETGLTADTTATSAQNRTSQAPEQAPQPNKSTNILRSKTVGENGGSLTTQSVSTASRVRVVITLSDWSPAIASKLRERGATIETRAGTRVQAMINRSAAAEYRKQPWVERVRRPLTGTPQVVSEGVTTINADALHADGITGENVTIGVIDFGFDPTNSEIKRNLVEYRSFTQNSGIQGAGETAHGTAVAEIISDTAPDADLYVANFDTSVEYVDAAEWLHAQDVDVIVTSIGFVGVPYDGTSFISQSADRIVDDGVVWVNSAGNYAKLHWQGSMKDTDQDRWLEFNDEDETNYLQNPSEGTIKISLTWDDWNQSNQDYDLYLYRDPAIGEDQLVAKSAVSQTGSQTPTEFIETDIDPGFLDEYYVAVRNYDTSENHKFNLYVTEGAETLQYTVSQGSLSAPATGDQVLSIGAFDHETGDQEPFSSAGPTEDGDQGIDVLGPDGVTTSGYTRDCTLFFFCEGSTFYGTSAAAPHAAGVTGLMLTKNQQLQPSKVEQLLESTASDVPTGGFSYTSGHGEIAAARAVRRVPQSGSGSISLSTPETYTINNKLDVTGTASGAVTEVALYARRDGKFKLVGIDGQRSLAIDSDGTFAAEDVRLTAGSHPGNTLLSMAGTYEIAAIRAADADADSDGQPEQRLSGSIVSAGVSTQKSLTVTQPSLSAQFPTVEDGKLETNTLTVRGTAPGHESVLFVAVGKNGATVTEQLAVAENNSFSEDVALHSLQSGTVSLQVVASGGDQTVGDGDIPEESGNSLVALERYIEQTLRAEHSTRTAVVSEIRSQTTLEAGSDDQLISQTAQLQSSTTGPFQATFESTDTGEVPTGWVGNGNSALQVTDTVAASGSQSLRLRGQSGGCWETVGFGDLGQEAIPASSSTPDRDGVNISFSVRPRGQSQAGCHGTRNTKILLNTDNSPTYGGQTQPLMEFDAGGTVTAIAGENSPLGTYDVGTWTSVTITYQPQADGQLQLTYYVDGTRRGKTTISEPPFAADLAYLHIGSGEYTTYIDAIRIQNTTVRDSSGSSSSNRSGLDATGAFDPIAGEGTIFAGATVFQGEADIRFAGNLTPTLVSISDTSSSLTTPISRTQPIGRYSTDGTRGSPSITVARPRVTAFTVQNAAGTDLSGASLSPGTADNVTVVAASNFEAAEALELTVERESGTDITTKVLTTGSPVQTEGSDQEARWQLSFATVGPGKITISVDGSDDLDSAAVERATTVTVESDDSDSNQGSASQLTLDATVQDSGQTRGRARVEYVFTNTSEQNSVTLNLTSVPASLALDEEASDFDGGTYSARDAAVLWFSSSGTLEPTLVFTIDDDADSEQTFTIAAQAEDQNGSVVTRTQVTVGDVEQSVPEQYDMDGNGEIGLGEVRVGINDFAAGELSLRELRTLINYWSDGGVVRSST